MQEKTKTFLFEQLFLSFCGATIKSGPLLLKGSGEITPFALYQSRHRLNGYKLKRIATVRPRYT